MKIYTKTGDAGQTSLLGGTRVIKSHVRIEAYGTVDELNAYIGLLRDQPVNSARSEFLLQLQDRLFTMGSWLAADPVKLKMTLPEIHDKDITALEEEIDQLEESLPPLKHFILPGGHPAVSTCHIARCVCRRAERRVIELMADEPVDERIARLLNRLSDYLFVLSRKMAQELEAPENPWLPQK